MIRVPTEHRASARRAVLVPVDKRTYVRDRHGRFAHSGGGGGGGAGGSASDPHHLPPVVGATERPGGGILKGEVTLGTPAERRHLYEADLAMMRHDAAQPKHSDASPQALAEAAKILTRLGPTEQRATADLRATVEARGGEMYGLRYRLKTQASMARKIDLRIAKAGGDPHAVPTGSGHTAQQPGMSHHEAAASITDALRYTAHFPHETIARDIPAMLDGLRARGYTVGKLDNSWAPGSAYKAVHADLVHPDGTHFELQFHTVTSEATKLINHLDYEVLRQVDTPPPVRERLAARMAKRADALVAPPGIEAVAPPVRKARVRVPAWR